MARRLTDFLGPHLELEKAGGGASADRGLRTMAALRKITVRVSLPPPAASEALSFECAGLCASLGLAATVTPTFSSVSDDHCCFAYEAGAAIDLHACSREIVCARLWPALQELYPFECAHIHEPGKGFNGCVYDYMRDSCCPGARRKKEKAALGLDSAPALEPAPAPARGPAPAPASAGGGP